MVERHPLDSGQPGQPFVAQLLECRNVRGRHPDEVVRLAEQPLGVHDLVFGELSCWLMFGL